MDVPVRVRVSPRARRMSTVSDVPPRYPATIPMNDPITIEIAVASSPTVSETRAPQIVRIRTERP